MIVKGHELISIYVHGKGIEISPLTTRLTRSPLYFLCVCQRERESGIISKRTLPKFALRSYRYVEISSAYFFFNLEGNHRTYFKTKEILKITHLQINVHQAHMTYDHPGHVRAENDSQTISNTLVISRAHAHTRARKASEHFRLTVHSEDVISILSARNGGYCLLKKTALIFTA